MRTPSLVIAVLLSAALRAIAGDAPAATPAPAAEAPKAEPAPGAAPELKTQKERASYAIGLNVGKQMKTQGVEVDFEALLRGFKDALSGAKPALTDKEIRETMMALQKESQARQADRMKTEGEKNKKEGEAFLAENGKKPGVTVLPSGLQYKVITEGNGAMAKATDTVVVNYRGTLIDGSQFDSSYDRGQPAEFQVNRVIKGWTEALQLMPVGSKWQIWIPSAIAQIGPNATLIFEVELLEIKAK
jgi:FKBP-type peptidyl-prolyl cis-trans isomerase FklB